MPAGVDRFYNAEMDQLVAMLQQQANVQTLLVNNRLVLVWRTIIHPATTELLARWGLGEDCREMVGAMLSDRLMVGDSTKIITLAGSEQPAPKRRKFDFDDDDLAQTDE